MTISSALKTTNPLLLSNRRRQIFDRNNNVLCCSKSFNFPPISRSLSVKAKSFMNSKNWSSILTSKNDASIPPEIVEPQTSSKDGNSAVLNILKWLRIPAVVGMLSLLLTMIMYGHRSALASSVGAMGGRFFQPVLSEKSFRHNSTKFFFLIGVIRFSCAHPNQFEILSHFVGMIMLRAVHYIIDLLRRIKIVKLQVGRLVLTA